MFFGAIGEFTIGELPASNVVVAAAAATITITGHDVGLYASRVLTAEAASFVLTFNSVELARGKVGLSVSSGGGVRGLRASTGGGGKGLRIRA